MGDSLAMQPWLRDLSIRHKLRLAIMLTTSVAILFAAAAVATLQWWDARDGMRRDLSTLARVLAANSTAAISFRDRQAGGEILSALRARPSVIQACLFESSGDLFASYAAEPGRPECQIQTLDEHRIASLEPVELEGELLGRLLIIESDAALWEGLKINLAALGLVFAGCLLLALLLSNALQKLIATPLVDLAGTALRISTSEDYSIRAEPSGRDEVGVLIQAFNTMLGQVEHAERDMRDLNRDLQAQVLERNRANEALKKTLDELRQTQDQLVQTEKMASLGSLVAGVAHEINTPLGIGVTAASTLSGRAEELRDSLKAETLTASELNRFLELVEQTTAIILNNLQRGATLVQSFKQVAVDQSTAEHRSFGVRSYLEEILLSLRPKLKKTRVEVELDCDPDLEIDSYPGALSQIITNLVVNALTHAFEPDQDGQILIRVRPTDEGLNLEFRDDGRGITADVLPRIFDPFFTTRRGAGGSGLGLHIIFNLVTQQLGGRIRADSTPGQGTVFTLNIKSFAHVKQP